MSGKKEKTPPPYKFSDADFPPASALGEKAKSTTPPPSVGKPKSTLPAGSTWGGTQKPGKYTPPLPEQPEKFEMPKFPSTIDKLRDGYKAYQKVAAEAIDNQNYKKALDNVKWAIGFREEAYNRAKADHSFWNQDDQDGSKHKAFYQKLEDDVEYPLSRLVKNGDETSVNMDLVAKGRKVLGEKLAKAD